MFHLENDNLKVTILGKGAELKSVTHKQNGLEYMWSGDPAYWAKTSPVLFPIVGQLRENRFQYNGKTYALPRHGFAREKEFTAIEQRPQSITFLLQSNEETMAVYPFTFSFAINYELKDDELIVTYRVQNNGSDDMFFSVGGHPAFKLPLVDGTTYEDYSLRFSKAENAGRWPISKEGCIETAEEPLLVGTNVLPLKKSLFEKDAVVFKHLRSDEVELVSDKTPHGFRFSFAGFPFLGLWAAPGADFLCIEPWCGIADSVDSDGQLQNKEGINKLAPFETFLVSWKAKFY